MEAPTFGSVAHDTTEIARRLRFGCSLRDEKVEIAKSIDSRRAGTGDLLVGLWIAEGARACGVRTPFVDEPRGEIVRAFGHETVPEPTEDCMGLGSGSDTYETEMSTASTDRSLRVERWQRTVGWDFGWRRPVMGPLPQDSIRWADALVGDGPIVVIAPRAAFNTRSLPMQKWLRIAGSLKADGIRTVAIDGKKEVVEAFPLYAYGFSWMHVMALLDRAAVVAGNDSGISHLASTIGKPTVVASGPTDPKVVFGHAYDVLRPVMASTVDCVGCHFQGSHGFQVACDRGCDALQSLPWQAMKAAIVDSLEGRVGSKAGFLTDSFV